MHITGIYAALAALLVLVLAFRVSMARRATHTGIGDGGHSLLALRMRAHGNAVEYLPLALILLLMLELNQTQPLVLHVCGIVLIVSRVLHGFGLSRSAGTSSARFVGILGTWLIMLVMALLLLWQFALRLFIA